MKILATVLRQQRSEEGEWANFACFLLLTAVCCVALDGNSVGSIASKEKTQEEVDAAAFITAEALSCIVSIFMLENTSEIREKKDTVQSPTSSRAFPYDYAPEQSPEKAPPAPTQTNHVLACVFTLALVELVTRNGGGRAGSASLTTCCAAGWWKTFT